MKRRMLCIVLAVLTAVGSLAGVSLAASNTVPILVGYADVDYMADEILKTIPTGAKTDEERIGAVYDWVVTNCSRNGGDGTEYFDEAAVEREAALYASAAETRTAKGQAAVRKELES